MEKQKKHLFALGMACFFISAFLFLACGQGLKTGEKNLLEEKEIDSLPFSFSLDDLNTRENLCIQAVGDILLARDPGLLISRRGWQYPFANVRSLISEGDINFCNVETPASFLGTPYPGKLENITFRANPGVLFALKDAGFNLISLANNHMGDYGPEAIAETIEALDLLELPYAGAGRNKEEAYAPRIISHKGWKIALLAYAEPIWSVTEAREKAGVAHLKKDEVILGIQKAREEYGADIVLLSLHWGEEYSHNPYKSQENLAHDFIDAGADLILGHHPHVLQGIELYKGKAIFYSLGNFLFDQIDDVTYQTLLARIVFNDKKEQTVLVRPMRIVRRALYLSLSEGEDLALIAGNVARYSKRFGTSLEEREAGWFEVKKIED